MKAFLFATMTLGAAACCAEAVGPARGRPGGKPMEAKIVGELRPGVLSVAEVPVPARLQPVLASVAGGNPDRKSVLLTLHGVRASAKGTSLRVLLDAPGNGMREVGTVHFFPDPAPEGGYVLDLTRAVAWAGKPAKPGILRIVLEAVTNGDAPAGAVVAVSKLSVEIVD